MSRSRGSKRPTPRKVSKRRLQVESLEARLLLHLDLDMDGPMHDEEELGTFPAIQQHLAVTGLAPSGPSGPAGPAAGPVPLSGLPALSSLPSASAKLYLDFDGHFDAQWGSYSNITTPAYDTDGDSRTFSDAELSAIQQIWQRVAEDYAPFKIDVTTIEPSSFANGVALRVAIGGNGAWAGGSSGGISYINSFTNSVVNTAYVFPANLGNGYAKYVAEASSHEAGHGFGLQHQSQYDTSGNKTSEYYSGPGDGRAPIMGNSYSATRGLWWNGTSSVSSTSIQDDLAVISRSTNGFGYRTDDHGSSTAAATPLTVSGTQVSGAGVITTTGDADWFSFTTGAGQVSLTVSVPANINNLDARLELRDAAGNVITSTDPGSSFGATITTTLQAGSYYLVVASHGSYGDVGQYSVSGTQASATTVPNAPGGLTATAASSSQINLSWSDVGGETGYQVERSTNGVNWSLIASPGANATSYQNAGLSSSTTYYYRVRAVNAGGSSDYSATASATTSATTSTPAAPTNLTATAPAANQVVLNWIDHSSVESGFRIYRSSNNGASYTQIGQVGPNITSFTDTTTSASRTYKYRVRAFNNNGSSSYTNTVTVTTPAAGASPAPSFSDVVSSLTPSSGKSGPEDQAAPSVEAAAFRFVSQLAHRVDTDSHVGQENLAHRVGQEVRRSLDGALLARLVDELFAVL